MTASAPSPPPPPLRESGEEPPPSPDSLSQHKGVQTSRQMSLFRAAFPDPLIETRVLAQRVKQLGGQLWRYPNLKGTACSGILQTERSARGGGGLMKSPPALTGMKCRRFLRKKRPSVREDLRRLLGSESLAVSEKPVMGDWGASAGR
ncbi:hypothetical protein EYF80_010188 [Liparis tanakae]|uniref:Uncharacterized protein n=1 Tax=Liparis tanakae TaxID=230148 RepID=A0A4Z2IP15_9TELE|nr:hypothetical protein EYF80_010188 [Liparis tanakae]